MWLTIVHKKKKNIIVQNCKKYKIIQPVAAVNCLQVQVQSHNGTVDILTYHFLVTLLYLIISRSHVISIFGSYFFSVGAHLRA